MENITVKKTMDADFFEEPGKFTMKTWRDPYESGFSPTKPREITFFPGLTILVGCNGAGKTTLLQNIAEAVKKEHIPYHSYNNLTDGGSSSLSEMFYYGNYEVGACLWTASEGEAIKLNFGNMSSKKKIREFLQDGFYNNMSNRLARVLRDDKPVIHSKKRFLLLDAIDSGLSVDSVAEVREVFELILADAADMGIELYIIASANEYELARDSACFDVNKGRYLTFSNYEEYRSFILKSRREKEKRLAYQKEWFLKQEAKKEAALEKKKAKYLPKIQSIKDKAAAAGRNLTWSERYQIEEYERRMKEC